MKVDRSKLKRSSSEVPADCKALIEKLKNCNKDQLLHELKQIKSWTCGKCELYHWVDLLDVFDDILGECCAKQNEHHWPLPCDSPTFDPKKRDLLMHVISFTALLIEHSFSRHLYNSMDHLITLLSSSDMQIVLSVLGLLFVFSKRSNFINKLSNDKRQELITRLSYLAESWGGKENGFGLAECCRDLSMSSYPSSATTLHFEYYVGQPSTGTPNSMNNSNINKSQLDLMSSPSPTRTSGSSTRPVTAATSSATTTTPNTFNKAPQMPIGTRLSTTKKSDQDTGSSSKKSIKTIHIENVDQIKNESISVLMEKLVQQHDIPRDKQMQLFTHLRLAHNFSDHFKRMQCVQARLQAMSIIIYWSSSQTQEIGTQLLYNGFIEELVDILHLDENSYIDIKSAALRTLTSVVHLDRNSRLSTIIDATETSSYHGFLPVLVRNCIQSLINDDNYFPIPYATALFSFLYHLASFEKGGEALVSCGIIESLLKIINWTGTELEHITFVTRSVRVIDLITNIDMTVFQSQSGLNIFIERLDAEVKICRKELCDDIDDVDMNETSSDSQQPMDVDSPKASASPPKDIQCYTQRAALLKSMLNFLKKAIQDATFSDCIRHLMDGSLPKSLRHIISNANYYGSSLFLLSIELVSAYVFQEPALLSSLQESQLTKDILDAILDKPLPPTREILAALPNTFTALCLNSAGLQAFQARKPFEKIFRVLISPEYLPAMRRRKTDLSSDTATNLGNSMDELMRHQPSLRADVVTAIINLLKELCDLGDSPSYTCCTKLVGKSSEPVTNPVNADLRALQQNNESAAVFSDEEDEDDEDSASPPVVPNQAQTTTTLKPALAQARPNAMQNEAAKTPVPLVDYIFNVMRFVDAILTNNSTDDHVREFLRQDGLIPLLRLMRLRNLPIDFPTTQACNGISSVCRSILALARDPKVVQEALKSLDEILDELQSLQKTSSSASCSVLLEEYGQVASSTNISDPNVLSNLTPALHSMSAAHAYIVMFSCINRANHPETRNICINHWGKDLGLKVLEKMSRLYMALVWESTVLITINKGDRVNVTGLSNEVEVDDSNQTQQQQQPSTSDTKGETSQSNQATSTMDIDDTSKSSSDRKSKSKGKKIMVEQSKLIKPLLVSTSRLGKGLAELFALLVKLSVGSPLRHRRNNHSMQNTPTIPSSAAQNVASVFARLIAEGLNLDSHPSPPKHWPTFFICFSSFTQTMLFDERKNPFHLMLRDLYKYGGLEAFFKTFEWFIAQDQRKRDELNDSNTPRAEFLDSWLSLLEKMVNPKMVLETPHAMAPKASTPLLEYSPFDPIQYLIVVHKRAFHCIDSLWRLQSGKYFSDQTSEHILSILCHILKGETIISEHLRKGAEGQPQPTVGQVATPAASTPPQPNVNQDHLQQLIDMGFAREAVIDALMQCQSLVQAMEFLLSAPQPASAEVDTGNGQDVDMVPEDASEQKQSTKTEPTAQQFELKKEEPLGKDKIDTFTKNLLPGSLCLMDELPSTVYKVCDLILTVAHRNGESWCSTLLTSLLSDIIQNVRRLLGMAEPLRARDSKSVGQWASEMRNAPEAGKVAVRIHLYSLLFDEMKVKCADLLQKSNALDSLVALLEVGLDVFSLSQDDSNAATPKWLAPTVLLTDLYEKGAVSSQRRAPLLNNQTRHWLYFDERTSRWTPHMSTNNKIIDDAYKNGDQYARYSVGRKHYIAQFSQMLQINEDTSNFRPIMMTLQPVAEDSMEHNQDNLVPVVERLREHQAKTLIRVCVGFMNLHIDSNSLQAIMRLCFRLTRDHELAVMFAELGGVKAIQNLPEISNFPGFVSLATLVIRHVIEEPTVLHQTMEKVIRSTTQHLQHNQREMHYLLRVLGSSACRNEETFKKLITEILRIIPMSTNRRDDDDGSIRTKSDSPQLIKLLPPKTSETVKPSSVTRCVIADLLDSLTIPMINRTPEATHSLHTNPSPVNMSQELNRAVGQPIRSDSAAKSNELPPLDVTIDVEPTPERLARWHSPILNHSIVLRLLAELTRSYSVVPKIIVDHVYTPSTSESITQDISALAYILDNILPTTQTHGDRDAPSLARVFLASLAACNHCVEAQVAVVNEVKASLDRAALLPESSEKHARLQSLAAIIFTMIDCCPAIPPQQSNQRANNSLHQQQQLSNNIVRLFVRKGLVTDLAKIPHSLDLSAPHMYATVNAILKPLEALSRFVNLSSQPGNSRHHSSQTKKELICSSSSSSSGDDEETAENNVEEVSGVGDEREEDAEDEDDDEEEDDEDDHVDDDEDHVDDDEHVDNDEDHVDDDEDHVEDDVGDEDENLNAFGDNNQFADDYPVYNGQLNNVLNDIEEAFLQSNHTIYHERPNPVLPAMYDATIDQHESAPPSVPPPPGNVGLTHPLLLRRVVSDHGPIQISGAPPISARTHRYGRPRLLRGAASAAHSQLRHPSQTILQQLLGTNSVQEVMTLTNQFVGPGRLFVADFQNWLATDDELYPDHSDSHTLTSSHPSALSSIPLVMARWTDESRILDGGSLHDCLTNLKQEIVPILERYEEEENQDRQEKRKKMIEDEERAQQKKCKEPQQLDSQDPLNQQQLQQQLPPEEQSNIQSVRTQDLTQPPPQASSDVRDPAVESTHVLSQSATTTSSDHIQALTQESLASNQSHLIATPPQQQQQQHDQSRISGGNDANISDSSQIQPENQEHLQRSPAIVQQISEQSQQQLPSPAPHQNTGAEFSSISRQQEQERPPQDQQQLEDQQQQQQQPQQRLQQQPSQTLEPQQAQASEQQPYSQTAASNQHNSSEGTSTANMESDIPEGVDPSFLAALPEDIRQEVLADQWRIRRLERANSTRQNDDATANRTDQATTSTGTTFPEVNPEFLAALPAEVQEEVLAQQRAEQQRQAATTANPDQPVDPAIFIQTLAPNLRRQVLADMDDSLLPHLPTDIATEAMVLRRELLSSANANSTLSRLLRTAAAGRIQRARYTIAVPDHVHNHSSWSWALERPSASMGHGNSSSRNITTFSRDPKFKGRQLLDCEALTCLIILLFVQEPRLNITRLHRVLRNLSYHRNTRQWVIHSMLSIVERARINPEVARNAIGTAVEMQPQTRSSSSGSDLNKLNHSSSWLSISMDAALGCRASVFLAPRASPVSSPSLSTLYSGRSISIHPQAAPAVCRHMLETLITLAKSFPEHFFPEALQIHEDNNGEESSSSIGSDFWEILAKLDSFHTSASNINKRGRGSAKQQSSGSSSSLSGGSANADKSPAIFLQIEGFDADELTSPLAKLMGFLAHPIIRRSPALTDRLLHLLAVISMSFPIPSDPNFETWSQINSSRAGQLYYQGHPMQSLHRSNAPIHHTMGHLIHNINSQRHHYHHHHHHPHHHRPVQHHSNTFLNNNNSNNLNMIGAGSNSSGGNSSANNAIPAAAHRPQQEPPTANPSINVPGNDTAPQSESSPAPTQQPSCKASVNTVVAANTNKPKQPLVSQTCLKLAVDVLTSKSCSEEGLDDVTTLLSRLSRSCSSTRTTVLDLLMEGARQLGHNVCQHISTLKDELKDYNQKLKAKQAGTSADSSSPSAKGVVQDRFTNESVIITAQAAAGSKGGREVQLPSMAALTSKNSSQAFFLRILKVVIQLRETLAPNLSLSTKPTPVIVPPVQSETTAQSGTQQASSSDQQQQHQATGTTGNIENGPSVQMEVDVGASSQAASNTEDLSMPSVKVEDGQLGASSVVAATASMNVAPKGEESLSIELQLDNLWETLSECLLELADTPDHHAVLVLQPAVEAFFLVHSPGFNQRAGLRHIDDSNGDKNSQTAHIDQEVAPISPAAADTNQGGGNSLNETNNGAQSSIASGPASSNSVVSQNASGGLTFDTQKFLQFAETHRVVLNHILRQSTTPLSQGPFAVLVDHTRVLDFDVKRRYFRQELERLDEGIRRDDLGIHVRRENVFEESFRELHRRSAEEWKNRFFVVFIEEEGQDAGGLLREWYTIISREIFNPMYALFTTSPGDRVTYMINSASHCNTNHLTYFKFVGRVIAKAIYDNKLLDCYFTRSFYKHILGKPVKYTDMESEDYSFYQGLVFLLDHDVSELGSELTFSVEVREFGVTEVRELKPNGSNIPVTEENKHEYVRLVCQEKMTGSIRKQLNAFLEGFYDIIPKRLISIFNEQELELLISGLPNIDIDDLKASTEYHKYLPNSLQIQWFWRALRSFDQADRAKLLQFVTGTSKVPLQGFSSLEGMNGVQKFQIHRDERSTDRLPSAHTCFNQLDLPVYETYDKLRYMLLKAIRECSEGFGLA